MLTIDRGSGTPLVLLHGFGVDHRILLPLDPVLEAAGGWRRIYLDLPGATGTPIGDVASSDDVVRTVEEHVRGLLGDEPFALLGNSWGGMIARRVAHDLREQVLGLATLAGVFVPEHDLRDLDPRTVVRQDEAAREVAGAAVEAYLDTAVVESPGNARAFLEHVLPGLEGADQAALERISECYPLAEPPETSEGPFMQPTLLLTARQDSYVGHRDAHAALEHYPRATFATLDSAGHNVHLDQPALTAALLTDWLARIRAA